VESYEVLGIFGWLNISSLGVKLIICIRVVLRRFFHGRVSDTFGVHGNLPVCISHHCLGKTFYHRVFQSYLNNPEAMGAAFFGLALISASKLVLCLAVVRHLASWWFLSNVEQYDIPVNFLLPWANIPASDQSSHAQTLW